MEFYIELTDLTLDVERHAWVATAVRKSMVVTNKYTALAFKVDEVAFLEFWDKSKIEIKDYNISAFELGQFVTFVIDNDISVEQAKALSRNFSENFILYFKDTDAKL